MFLAHLSLRAWVLHVWSWDQQQQHCLGRVRNASSQAHPRPVESESPDTGTSSLCVNIHFW